MRHELSLYRAPGLFTNTTMNETAVLCLTVRNSKYPITLVRISLRFRYSCYPLSLYLKDVIRKICAMTGQVLRICILRKRDVQVLVEFDSPQSARKIKDELDGVSRLSHIETALTSLS